MSAIGANLGNVHRADSLDSTPFLILTETMKRDRRDKLQTQLLDSVLLRAINLPEDYIEGALRIGIGKFTTEAEIDQAVNILSRAVFNIRSLISS